MFHYSYHNVIVFLEFPREPIIITNLPNIVDYKQKISKFRLVGKYVVVDFPDYFFFSPIAGTELYFYSEVDLFQCEVRNICLGRIFNRFGFPRMRYVRSDKQIFECILNFALSCGRFSYDLPQLSLSQIHDFDECT